MALPTYVQSINGYTEVSPYKDSGIALDASDIRIEGSTGETVRSAAFSVAEGMRILTMKHKAGNNYQMDISAYELEVEN